MTKSEIIFFIVGGILTIIGLAIVMVFIRQNFKK